MTIEGRLSAMGLSLPDVPAPVGHYTPAVRTGNLVFTSGQTARINGVRRYVGVVGRDVTVEEAYLSVRDSVLNCLACVRSVAGSLEHILAIVKSWDS